MTVRPADGRNSRIDSYLPMVKVSTCYARSCKIVWIDLLIIRDLKFPVVLGTPWLREANPKIDWATKELLFPTDTIDELVEGDFKGT
jgi:hypothetical protein